MGKEAKEFDFKRFATPRIIGGIAIVVVVLWALSVILGSPQGPASKPATDHPETAVATARQTAATAGQTAQSTAEATGSHAAAESPAAEGSHAAAAAPAQTPQAHGDAASAKKAAHPTTNSHAAPAVQATASHDTAPAGTGTHGTSAAAPAESDTAAAQPGTAAGHLTAVAPVHKPLPKGVAFVEAAIKPLKYELEERWWGWRPNDIIDVTDNVNNFQMGVLEVTRRTVVALAERISRTGVTDSLNPNLEDAMNWFMVKAGSYWFPSAESKYREGLEELEVYLEKLKAGQATFYTRTDNLIPLLASFEDLLGSCDENLVKQIEEDGSPVSFFAADDYFYYTQGVASAMATVLEAIHHDFLLTLESRHGTELLHHAIVSCQQAAALDPWIVLDRDLSSLFANHRANMAAPISHARFYIGQLIKTLST